MLLAFVFLCWFANGLKCSKFARWYRRGSEFSATAA